MCAFGWNGGAVSMRSILVRFNSSILVRNSRSFLIIERIIITLDTLDIRILLLQFVMGCYDFTVK